MADKESIKTFWTENYLILKTTAGSVCPSPQEAYTEFQTKTGNSQVTLESFKNITCSMGMGIRLNKKRRKNQKRFYNVAPKRRKMDDSSQKRSETVVEDCHTQTKPDHLEQCPESSFDDLNEEPDHLEQCPESSSQQDPKQIENYLLHQSSMQIQKKTMAALQEKHQAPSTRKQMFDMLKAKGLYKKSPAHKFKKFHSWLKSPSGGQLKCPEEIISEVNRYLYFCHPEKIKWKKLLDSKSLNSYLILTKDAGLGPDGIKTKIERISTALKYLAHKKPHLYQKCHQAINDYREWLKPLMKQKKILRMKNSWRDEICGFHLIMEDLDTAVSKETVARFITIMKNAMSNEKLSQEDYRLIVDTLITITMTQESAIRPGAFQFMTLQELDNPITYISPSDGTVYNIVFVLNHKTVGTHGPLAVPFPETVWVQLHNYIKYVRPQVKPKIPHQHLVFLNATGNMIRQPGKAVSKITKHHKKKVTPTKIRHCVATVGSELLTDIERRAVAKGIGHTMEVHNRVYTDLTIKSVKASIEAQKKLHDKSKSNTL